MPHGPKEQSGGADLIQGDLDQDGCISSGELRGNELIQGDSCGIPNINSLQGDPNRATPTGLAQGGSFEPPTNLNTSANVYTPCIDRLSGSAFALPTNPLVNNPVVNGGADAAQTSKSAGAAQTSKNADPAQTNVTAEDSMTQLSAADPTSVEVPGGDVHSVYPIYPIADRPLPKGVWLPSTVVGIKHVPMALDTCCYYNLMSESVYADVRSAHGSQAYQLRSPSQTLTGAGGARLDILGVVNPTNYRRPV
jgi:hypothetical protein